MAAARKKSRFHGFRTVSGSAIGRRAKKITGCENCMHMEATDKLKHKTGGTCPRCGAKTLRLFDSKGEASYANLLKVRAQNGEIMDLKYQPRYDLHVPNFHSSTPSKLCTYVADFSYLDKSGTLHVLDYKGAAISPEAKLKITHFEMEYGIPVELVTLR